MKIVYTIVNLIVAGILYLMFVVPFVGWHIVTSHGEHRGFVTAVETSGVLFKTHTAYIKTDTQSSQEDSYCVVDDSIFGQLRKLAETKEPITVIYIDWFSKGISNCNGEIGGVITGIK